MSKIKEFSLPTIWKNGLSDHEFWWDEDINKNHARVVEHVRKMSLREIQETVVDLIMLQLEGKIILVSKEE